MDHFYSDAGVLGLSFSIQRSADLASSCSEIGEMLDQTVAWYGNTLSTRDGRSQDSIFDEVCL